MQVRCIRAYGLHKPAHTDADGNTVPADVVEVPDGAAVDPYHYEPVTALPPPAPSPPPQDAAPAAPSAPVFPPKEM